MSWLPLNRFLQTDLVTDFVDQSGLTVSTDIGALWFRNDVFGVEITPMRTNNVQARLVRFDDRMQA